MMKIRTFLLLKASFYIQGCCGYAYKGQQINYPQNSTNPEYRLFIYRETQRSCKAEAPFTISIQIKSLRDQRLLLSRKYTIDGLPETCHIRDWSVEWHDINEVNITVHSDNGDKTMKNDLFQVTYIYNETLDHFTEKLSNPVTN